MPVAPAGAFYVLADARRWDSDSRRLAFRLLEEAHLAITPGIDFGAAAEGWLRFLTAGRIRVLSAGTAPVGLNRRALLVMQEAGVDIASQSSDSIEDFLADPPDLVISERTSNPYKTHSLIAAGAISLLGAFEAFLKVRGNESSGDGNLLALDVGQARLMGPSVSARGSRLTLSLVQVTF